MGLSSGVVALAEPASRAPSRRAVKCWGDTAHAELPALKQVATVAVPRDVTAVAVRDDGKKVSCALTTAGAVKCWGGNTFGQLGDGTNTDRLSPVDVVGLSSGVVALAIGQFHACALDTGGSVRCWGSNSFGALGDGSRVSARAPVQVVGLSGGVSAIAAGVGFSCALTTSGGVKCWGGNASGAVGDGSTVDRLTPVDVLGLTAGVQAIGLAHSHACAVTNSGGVKCWGFNGRGQLGDGTTTDRHTAVDVVGLTGAVRVQGGGEHSCALAANGTVSCWGANFSGQLGDGTATDRLGPVAPLAGVQAIATGTAFTCALTVAGAVKCWGDNREGQLGDGTTVSPRLSPVDVSGR